MILDEAIKRCKEVAEKNEEECKNWTYGASRINDDESRKKQYLKHAEMWQECAEEQRQLAEWLKDYKRLLEQEPVLDRIRAEIQKLRNCSCSNSDGIIDDVEDILDKYKASPTGAEGSEG